MKNLKYLSIGLVMLTLCSGVYADANINTRSMSASVKRLSTLEKQLNDTVLSQRFVLGGFTVTFNDYNRDIPFFDVLMDQKSGILLYDLDEIAALTSGDLKKASITTNKKKYIFNGQNYIEWRNNTLFCMVDGKLKKTTDNFVVFNGVVYVSPEILSLYFQIQSNTVTLTATFNNKFLSLSTEARKRKAQEKALKLRGEIPEKTVITSKSSLMSLGRVGLSYGVRNTGSSLLVNYFSQMLYGDFILNAQLGETSQINQAYIRYLQPDNQELDIGKGIYGSGSLNGLSLPSLVGAYYGKSNYSALGYGTMDISGSAENATRAELYRNGVLLNFQYISNGQYNFNAVTLQSTQDVFVVRLYSSDGTYSEKTVTAYSAMGFLKPGQNSLSLLNGMNRSTGKAVFSNEVNYGLTANTTVSVGSSKNDTLDAFSTGIYYKNRLIFPFYSLNKSYFYSDNSYTASSDNYFNTSDTTQLNLNFLSSTQLNQKVFRGNFYITGSSVSTTLSTTINYTELRNDTETLTLSKALLSNLYTSVSFGVANSTLGSSAILGLSANLSLFSGVYFNTATTFYQVDNTTSTALSLLFTNNNYSLGIQTRKDNSNQWSTGVNFALPLGIGFFDFLSADASSDGSKGVSVSKNIILAHPLRKSSVGSSASSAWINGRVIMEDGSVYSGGEITIAGRVYKISEDGKFFVDNIIPNAVTAISLANISKDTNYAADEDKIYIKARSGSETTLNIVVRKATNLFGSVDISEKLQPYCKVDLISEGQVVKTVHLQEDLRFAFTNIVAKKYEILVYFSADAPKDYREKSMKQMISLSKDKFVTIAKPMDMKD